tara:strand:- start:1119 stop:1796 length:678 start_codon:yes stop_codon:yes gene_type:complete
MAELIQLIILGVMAFVIFNKLREVLGKRTGHEKDRSGEMIEGPAQDAQTEDSNIIALDSARGGDWTLARKHMTSVDAETQLRALNQVREDFDPNEFLQGAKAAYEMIMEAYVQGNRDMLRNLMNEELFDAFDGAITSREEAGNKLSHDVVGITASRITGAQLHGTTAVIGIDFDAEVIIHMTDADGQTLEGSPEAVQTSREYWEFEKDLANPNPNWTLISTQARG